MLKGSCHCGAVSWQFDGDPESATACNCTICRRYGALWIYGWDGIDVAVQGPSKSYVRGQHIGFHFCPTCGCLAYYSGLEPDPDGRLRIAANLRMIDDPATVEKLPIRRFDGLDQFKSLPRDGRCVADLWF
ncbi:MAG: GFA family protein [Pseudomonadota bacterium]